MQTTVIGPPLSPVVAFWHRVAPYVGLVVIALVVLTATRPDLGRATHLSGKWTAEVDGAPTEVTLPGMFAVQGLPPDARIRARRSFVVEHARSAILVDSAMFAVTVTFDGRVVGGAGDPASDDARDRDARTLVVDLPVVEPGSVHEIGLDVRGDYGKGGLRGMLLLGRADELHSIAAASELRRLAVALALALLGAIPLSVAVRHVRPASVAFGSFSAVLSILNLVNTDLFKTWLPDPLISYRLALAAGFGCSGLGVVYVDSFANGTPGRPATGFASVVLGFAVASALVPASLLWGFELAVFAMAIVFAGWFTVRTHAAWRERLAGSWVLVGALVCVLWGTGTDLALQLGLRAGDTTIPAATLTFTLALGAALAVREAERADQHERLVRSSLDAMITVDDAGRIEHANPAAQALLGSVAATVPQAGLLALVAEAHRPLVRGHLQRATTRADRCEFPTARDRMLESLATPLGGGLAMLTLRDITLRREMDRSVLTAARLETAGVLMGGIAHDFNNMLGSVLAHVGLLRMLVPDPRVRERLDKIEGTVERASELTRRLITIARGTGSELSPMDVRTVCRNAADLAEPTFPPDVRLTLDLPDGLPLALGAAGDLEQVLLNLLVNARDAVGERGSVHLTARPLARNAGVCVAVEDDGPGIPVAMRDRIFEPFFTQKAHGTGLGLAVSRQILRDHHGRLWLEDRPGGGARFLVALRHADAVDEAPASLPALRRVLVVEDEAALLEAQSEALRTAGYDVTALQSAVAAAKWLQDHEVDLLVTDLRMPGLDGAELARLCRKRHPESPILFVTAFVPDEGLGVLEPGTWASLLKPVRPARLVATVGHLRRRAERAAAGHDDVTVVALTFPALDELTAASLGF